MAGKYKQTPGGIFVPEKQQIYKSSELFLSMIKAEYQNEKETATAIDSKIALSLPVVCAYIFLVVQDENIRQLWLSITKARATGSLEAMLSGFFVVAIVTALMSLIFMIHSTWTHDFKGVDITQSYNEKSMSMSKERFSADMAKVYLENVKQYREENSARAKEYQFAWLFGIASLCFFLLYTLGMQSWDEPFTDKDYTVNLLYTLGMQLRR